MDNKWFTNHSSDLRKYHIMFFGQCTNLSSTKLLECIQLMNPRTQSKKRKPKWYTELEHNTIDPYDPDRLIPNKQPQENIFHQYIEGAITKATQISLTASLKHNII